MRTGFWCETVAVVMLARLACGQSSFINFETAPVHPLGISPHGQTLAVCNLPAGRVELFDLSHDIPILIRSVAVGVDPVSVRFRNSNELWVVNHISSSVNVVDVAKREVIAVYNTLAGPCDVLFAGSPQRAFVSCARENTVQVVDPDTRQVLTNLVIEGDRPKALAASPDGRRVYVAIFESGNASTVLVGVPQAREPLRHPNTPYHGQFPPPNDGSNLNPPLYMNPTVNPMLYSNGMPRSLIVKKNMAGRWMDDNDGDWTEFISGTNSTLGSWDVFGRPQGWDMPDRDLAIIDTADYSITYAQGLMNICMDVAVNPASGTIAVIGTDATNERRFEPNLRGTFVRVKLALIDPLTLSKSVLDLNPHLDYSTPSVPRAIRDLSIGDPRSIVWNAAGTRSYVIGMGSHNLVMTDAAGHRLTAQPIELDDGPAGLALDETHQRLYVLNRFAATLSVLDTAGLTKLTNIALFDPTPTSIKLGRRHLYDRRKNSGLGHVSCASCHVDARFDRLAWDLGNPQADTLTEDHSDAIAFHPMKGPLVTQTLQDIIGHEPLHWRGDRPGIEDFNVTFTDLLAADAPLTTNEMQELKAFLSTIHFPPNHLRNFDNSLPTNLPLPGIRGLDGQDGLIVVSNGVLPNGNAVRGEETFRQACVSCHQSGSGRAFQMDDGLATVDGLQFKIAQMRSLPDKLGFDLSSTSSRAGFGFRFDGRDDMFRSVSTPIDDQERADLVAFLLAFTGGETFFSSITPIPSKDAAASLGRQLLLSSPGSNAVLTAMLLLAQWPTNRLDLIACGVKDGLQRSWFYEREISLFQSDRNEETVALNALLPLATPDTPLIFMLVARGSGRRLGIDRDEDRYFDRTELDNFSDPANSASFAGNAPPQLVALPRVELHPGMTLSTNLQVMEADLPAQRLTFSFVTNGPAAMDLNPLTGLLTWTPSAAQADQTYRFLVRATDDGIPAYSDTGIVEVNVVDLRVLFNLYSFGATIRWQAILGLTYRVQYKNGLEEPDWTDLAIRGGGFGGGFVFDPEAGIVPQRFYRITLME